MKIYIFITAVLFLLVFLIWYFSKTYSQNSNPDYDKTKLSYYSGLEKIELKIGQEKNFGGISLKFLSVKSDGRCPKGIECASFGEAIVEVEMDIKGNKEIFEQKIYGGVEAPILVEPDWISNFNIKEFEDSTLYLAGLEPYPLFGNREIKETGVVFKATFFYENKLNRDLGLKVLDLTDKELKSKVKQEGDIYKMVEMYPISQDRKEWLVEYVYGVQLRPSSKRFKFKVDLGLNSVSAI